MPVAPVSPIKLSFMEWAALENLVSAPKSEHRLFQRARMILLLSEGHSIHEVARRLGTWAKTVRYWRKRWLASDEKIPVEDRLTDAARSGRPATITPEQICSIIAMACEPPETYGFPITHWSTTTLAEATVKTGIIEEISSSSVGRILNEADLKPHLMRPWLNKKQDPDFDRKASEICSVYQGAANPGETKKNCFN